MSCENLPIQVIAHCGADGSLQPLRFRYEDPGVGKCTVQVERIMDIRQVELPGAEAILYLCKADNHLYELKFTLLTHRWVLFRQIY